MNAELKSSTLETQAEVGGNNPTTAAAEATALPLSTYEILQSIERDWPGPPDQRLFASARSRR